MPFCPNDECPSYLASRSRAEFVEGVARCSDCGAELVEEAPPLAEDDPWRWVVLERFNTAGEAHLARSLLESEGIPVSIPDEHLNEIHPLLGPALGWVRLEVPAELEAQARALLAKDESASVEDLVRSAPQRFTRTTAVGDRAPGRQRRGSVPIWLWVLWIALAVLAVRMALWQGE